jgi:hypothetical protein
MKNCEGGYFYMKFKLLILLTALGLILAVTNSADAFSFTSGPQLWKNFNWEIGTAYAGGVPGNTYFRDAGASYYTSEGVHVTYDPLDPTHGLFSDLIIVRPDGLRPGEDAFGLLEMRQIEQGEVIITGAPDAPFGEIGQQTPQQIYWNAGDGGEYVRGVFYDVQDQVVEFLGPDFARIYSANTKSNLYVMDSGTWNPQQVGNPTPADLLPDRTDATPWLIETDDWNATGDPLFEGIGDWFRYQGTIVAFPPSGTNFTYLSLFDVDGDGVIGDPSITNLVVNWWDNANPDDYPVNWSAFDRSNPGYSDVKQSWNIGQPVSLANGWVGSEDTAKLYIIPEPVTMLGVFLGLGSLVGYVRRVR